MQGLTNEKQEIIERIRNVKSVCKKYEDCKNCIGYESILSTPETYKHIQREMRVLAYKNIESDIKILDFVGCPFTNEVIRKSEEYEEKTGYDKELDKLLIGLTCSNQITALMNNDYMPDKENILFGLEHLETFLTGGNEVEDEEIESIPKTPEVYHALRVSKKVSDLF